MGPSSRYVPSRGRESRKRKGGGGAGGGGGGGEGLFNANVVNEKEERGRGIERDRKSARLSLSRVRARCVSVMPVNAQVVTREHGCEQLQFKIKVPGQHKKTSHFKFLQSWTVHKKYYQTVTAADDPDAATGEFG